MTFDDLKALIISRVKLQELCDKYPDLVIATTYDDLLNAATDAIEWVYMSGIFDASLFTEIPEATLNAHGIYINDATLTNPSGTIYIFGGVVSVTVNSNNRAKIKALASSDVTITLSDNAFADIKCFNSSVVEIDLDTNASALIEGTQQSDITVSCVDDTFINAAISDEATSNVTGDNNAYGRIRCYNDSSLNYTMNGSSNFNVQTYQKASSSTLAP